jgi:hypothetical protein
VATTNTAPSPRERAYELHAAQARPPYGSVPRFAGASYPGNPMMTMHGHHPANVNSHPTMVNMTGGMMMMM